jgi:CSLREA domain-containing protein
MTRTLAAGVALAVSAAVFSAPAALAAETNPSFTVNSVADAHDASPGNGICADSSGRCTLRAAIEESNAEPAGTNVTVTVPKGTYKLSLGTLAVTHNALTLDGASATTTIVEQNGTGAVASVAAGASATLAQLELTGGGVGSKGGGLYNAGTTRLSGATVTGNTASSGAGITNTSGGTLALTSSTVSNNIVASVADSQPGGSGGGIVNAGRLTLSGSAVSGNYAGEGGFGASDTGGTGGNGGGIDNTGTVAVVGGRITGNYAGTGGPGENEVPGDGGSGGGIYSSAGTVTVTNATVGGNFSGYAGPELTGDGPANAGSGGGLFNSAKLVVTGSAFSSNTGGTASGLGSDGGGIYNTGTATVATSTFTGNVSGTGGIQSGYGGAIANRGTLTLTNSTLAGNKAAVGGVSNPGVPGGNGGGLYQGGGTATLRGDTVTANASGNGGAGVFCQPCFSYGGPGGTGGGIYSTATLSVTNSTVSGNYVGVGGANAPPLAGSGPPGIGGGLATGGGSATLAYVTLAANTDGIDVVSGKVTLGGTIVADSTGRNDRTGRNCTGTISETAGFNLDSGTSCHFAASTDITAHQPLLGALVANGGPTRTEALKAGSPAIDHGGTAAQGCPATDQRGLPRPDETKDGGACDIGAYESQGLA